MADRKAVTVVEVGPRDGLQNQPVSYPTERKRRFVDALFASGLCDVEVTSSPSTERLRRVPREIRDKVRRLQRDHALEEATARQLAVVLGATTPFVCAGFCRENDPTEVLLVGWRADAAHS